MVLTSEKIATSAPIASASVAIASSAKPGGAQSAEDPRRGSGVGHLCSLRPESALVPVPGGPVRRFGCSAASPPSEGSRQAAPYPEQRARAISRVRSASRSRARTASSRCSGRVSSSGVWLARAGSARRASPSARPPGPSRRHRGAARSPCDGSCSPPRARSPRPARPGRDGTRSDRCPTAAATRPGSFSSAAIAWLASWPASSMRRAPPPTRGADRT